MKISVSLDVSHPFSSHSFELEDLGVSHSDWHDMTDEEKKAILQGAIDDIPEQPYWVLDSFMEQS